MSTSTVTPIHQRAKLYFKPYVCACECKIERELHHTLLGNPLHNSCCSGAVSICASVCVHVIMQAIADARIEHLCKWDRFWHVTWSRMHFVQYSCSNSHSYIWLGSTRHHVYIQSCLKCSRSAFKPFYLFIHCYHFNILQKVETAWRAWNPKDERKQTLRLVPLGGRLHLLLLVINLAFVQNSSANLLPLPHGAAAVLLPPACCWIREYVGKWRIRAVKYLSRPHSRRAFHPALLFLTSQHVFCSHGTTMLLWIPSHSRFPSSHPLFPPLQLFHLSQAKKGNAMQMSSVNVKIKL